MTRDSLHTASPPVPDAEAPAFAAARRRTWSTASASVAEHLRDPMRRNAYALMVGTGLTSVLGFVFWFAAARWFTAEAVGTGAALTSMVSFLATVSTLGLGNGLVRFLASAGVTARRLITTCYAICAGVAVVVALVFVLGQPLWARELGLLRSSTAASVAFVAATAVWVLFVLEEKVLIGLRRAVWVPALNGAYSAAKLALLPVLGLGAEWAIFGATVVPAGALVVVVTILVWRLLGRSRGQGTDTGLSVPTLARFALSDHTSALLWLATCNLMILVVLESAGAEASAYYFLAFTMAYTLYLVTTNMGSALVAEAASFPDRAEALGRQALRNAALVVGPLVVAGFLLAPWLLSLLGPDYAAQGTALLRLLILSALPEVVIGTALGMARVRRANRLIIGINLAVAVGVLGGSLAVIERWGLTGVGAAWLATQTLVALVLLVTRRSGLQHR